MKNFIRILVFILAFSVLAFAQEMVTVMMHGAFARLVNRSAAVYARECDRKNCYEHII